MHGRFKDEVQGARAHNASYSAPIREDSFALYMRIIALGAQFSVAPRRKKHALRNRIVQYDGSDLFCSSHNSGLGKEKVLTCHRISRDEEGLHKRGTGAGIRGTC